MRLFQRKPSTDDQADRCPRCRERVPDGAAECMMCGLALEPLRSAPAGDDAEAASGDRGDK